jgi:predicted esterase
MKRPSLAELRLKVLEFSQAGDLSGARELAQSALADFPADADRILHWIATLHVLNGDDELAVAALEDGVTRGLWWPPEALVEDPHLSTLRQGSRFNAIINACEVARAKAGHWPRADPLVAPGPMSPRAVLVVLHGRGQTAEEVLEQWVGATAVAHLVMPRSTQRFGMHTACWDDRRRAAWDVLRAVQHVRRRKVLRDLPLIVGGFSQGADVAIQLAITARVPATGFVAVAANADWSRAVRASARRPRPAVRGHILVGALEGEARVAACASLAEWLGTKGMEVRCEIVGAIAHAYPSDFAERLMVVLDGLIADGSARSR